MENPVIRKLLSHVPPSPRILCVHHHQTKRKHISTGIYKHLKKRGHNIVLYEGYDDRMPKAAYEHDIVITIGDASRHTGPQHSYRIADLVRNGTVYLHVDRAYLDFGMPMTKYRVCINSNQATDYIHAVDYPDDRFNGHYKLEPWRIKEDGPILICPTTHRHAELVGYDIDKALGWLLSRLEWITDRKLVRHTKGKTPLTELINGAYAVVSWASNTVIEAAMLGVPAYLMDPNFVAKPFCMLGVDQIDKPEFMPREQYFYNLAYHQWSEHDIIRGVFWDELIAPYLRGSDDQKIQVDTVGDS